MKKVKIKKYPVDRLFECRKNSLHTYFKYLLSVLKLSALYA